MFTTNISFFTKPEIFCTNLEIIYTEQMALLGFRSLYYMVLATWMAN